MGFAHSLISNKILLILSISVCVTPMERRWFSTFSCIVSPLRVFKVLGEFLYICEYLGVTPREFFDEDIKEPQLVQKLYELTRNMSQEDLDVLISTAERLNNR